MIIGNPTKQERDGINATITAIKWLIKARIKEIEKGLKKENKTIRTIIRSSSIRELNHLLGLFDEVRFEAKHKKRK